MSDFNSNQFVLVVKEGLKGIGLWNWTLDSDLDLDCDNIPSLCISTKYLTFRDLENTFSSEVQNIFKFACSENKILHLHSYLKL